MTIKELIEELEDEENQDANVCLWWDCTRGERRFEMWFSEENTEEADLHIKYY